VFATHFGGDLADAVAVVGQLRGQTGRPLRVQQLLFQLDYLQKNHQNYSSGKFDFDATKIFLDNFESYHRQHT
jgi:hypothetical protein